MIIWSYMFLSSLKTGFSPIGEVIDGGMEVPLFWIDGGILSSILLCYFYDLSSVFTFIIIHYLWSSMPVSIIFRESYHITRRQHKFSIKYDYRSIFPKFFVFSIYFHILSISVYIVVYVIIYKNLYHLDIDSYCIWITWTIFCQVVDKFFAGYGESPNQGQAASAPRQTRLKDIHPGWKLFTLPFLRMIWPMFHSFSSTLAFSKVILWEEVSKRVWNFWSRKNLHFSRPDHCLWKFIPGRQALALDRFVSVVGNPHVKRSGFPNSQRSSRRRSNRQKAPQRFMDQKGKPCLALPERDLEPRATEYVVRKAK